MDKALATHTIERASAALKAGACACLPEIVKLLRTLSSNSGGVSVDELAEVIEKDTVILAKVIGAANTFGYNPGAVPVTTVRQAVHVIGYDRIRSLAMSLLLLEQTARTHSLAERREAAALALTAGCLGQAMARSRFGIDPDEAFVCSSLRHFGRIVMAMSMGDQYHEVQQLRAHTPDDEAYRAIFGLTPLELSKHLLSAADLPREILVTLRDLPPKTLAALDKTPEALLLALTDFSSKLAEIALTPNLSAADFSRKSRALAGHYTKQLPGLDEEVLPLMTTTSQQLDELVRTFKLTTLPAESLARLKLRGAGIDPAASTPVFDVEAPPPDPDQPVEFTWEGEIERVTTLGTRAGISAEALMRAVFDSLRRGFEAPECLLFSPPLPGADYRLSHGHGPLFQRLRARARLRPDERTVFGVCLTRRENVVIHHAADPKIAPYLPDWLRDPLALGAFVLLPIVNAATVHGIVLVGWPESRQVTIQSEHLRLIRSLLGLVGGRSETVAA